MFYFFAAAIVILIGLGIAGWLAVDSQVGGAGKAVSALVGTAVVFVIVTCLFSIDTVSAGNTGLLYQFGTSGNIVGHTSSGVVWHAPWHGLREVNTRIQKAEFDNVETFSKETQQVFMDVTLNYHIDPAKIDFLYTHVGPSWSDTLLFNRVANDVKEVPNGYKSVDIAPNREAIRKAIVARLQSEMRPYGVTIDSLQIKNISYSKQFQAAIERKQQATQDAQAAGARVAQKTAEAQQQVATAKGNAEATLVNAKAQAEANRLLQRALTPNFIKYQQVLALKALASSGKVQLVPANAFLQVTP